MPAPTPHRAARPGAPNPGPRYRLTSLVGLGLKVRVAARARRLGDRTARAGEAERVQRAQLRALLRAARHTEFGRAHDFARIAGIGDDEQMLSAYRAAVPAAEYAAFRQPVARMREEGRPDVLWPGKVLDFAKTSGTTAGDKFIPVSRQMLRSNFLASIDIFAHLSRFGVSIPELTAGRMLFLGGSTDLTTNEHGVRTGDLSGIVTPLIRWPLSKVYSPGPAIALMSHWPDKIEAMARACLDQDIRFISGMPSWAIVLMNRVLELARQRGQPADAIRDVWPNLRVFVHGGVKYTPFEPRVRRVYSGQESGDDIPTRLELYPASEGFIALQDTPGDPGLRLLTDIGNFYEFIPAEEVARPDARAVTPAHAEPGQRYVVCMSTCAGLWRYIIGDVVEFDSRPPRAGERPGPGHAPPRLRIVGRHTHFINAFGENIIVEHIENAVARAARATGLVVGEFTAGPVYPAQGVPAGLQLVVETEATPSPEGLRAFRDAFDAAVKAQNVDYTDKRAHDVGMGPPIVSPVPTGTFHRWMESRGKLGGQNKCPRCANHREFLDGVLRLAGRGSPVVEVVPGAASPASNPGTPKA